MGIPVPVDDDVGLAHAIERMDVESKSTGARGCQLVARKYTLRQTTWRYEHLYAELKSAESSRLL